MSAGSPAPRQRLAGGREGDTSPWGFQQSRGVWSQGEAPGTMWDYGCGARATKCHRELLPFGLTAAGDKWCLPAPHCRRAGRAGRLQAAVLPPPAHSSGEAQVVARAHVSPPAGGFAMGPVLGRGSVTQVGGQVRSGAALALRQHVPSAASLPYSRPGPLPAAHCWRVVLKGTWHPGFALVGTELA